MNSEIIDDAITAHGRIVQWSRNPEAQPINIEVDGHLVPYIKGSMLPDGTVDLTLDGRFGLRVSAEEVERWSWFLANAMAISAGRTSHGDGSYLRNPHGRSGGGDPPPMFGDSL